ncbi:hypothetical protein FGO68_gene505 [Halteria grandinella]|uniref:FAD-binding PCMH-type domain-containing protein n=1 Tax=Halteria grandinella TaxID=5974 RepID=A0A8J8NR66_HALGN|nr:hypothetical protein FGO68_gene505 [Halteria grandinella]
MKQFLSRSSSLTTLQRRFAHLNILRNSSFATLTDKDITQFESLLGPNGILTGDAVEPHNSDWTKKYHGHSKLVLKPKTTEEVSAILRICDDKRLAIVPQGGNTGLVGGSQPVFDEIVLNFSRMNQIIDFDESYGIITCEAGCILQDLHTYLNAKGYLMPLDLGAKGSCQIGGNLATNAGGIHFIKYNSLHANCVGLEAVVPGGRVLDNITTLRKDNTGYDLKHLFIGAEGTLGAITKCAILCPPLPKFRHLCLVSCRSFEQVLKILRSAKHELSDILQAVEFMDGNAMETTLSQLNFKNPFESRLYPFYALVEVASNREGTETPDRLYELLGSADDLIIEGVVAQDETQLSHIWQIREEIASAYIKRGYTLKYDLSLAPEHFYKIVDDTRDVISRSPTFTANEKHSIAVTGYGHIGDGNVHLNVCIPGYDDHDLQDRLSGLVDGYVFEYVRKARGSVSAEHGVGLQKAQYLNYSKSENMIHYMKEIKRVFDPHGIMNPYKVLPDAK